jgi:hypothetical protein
MFIHERKNKYAYVTANIVNNHHIYPAVKMTYLLQLLRHCSFFSAGPTSSLLTDWEPSTSGDMYPCTLSK